MLTTITRQSPFTPYERRIIAAAVNQAEGIAIGAENVWTLRNCAETGTTWVHLYDGRQLPFDRNQFRSAIACAKKIVTERMREERKANKVARELRTGDRVVHDGRKWTVTSTNYYRVDGQISHSTLHAVKVRLTLFDGTKSKILLPYSEAKFEIRDRELASA